MSVKARIGRVFLVIVIAAVAEFLSNVLLGRSLSPSLFGQFKFIHTIVMLVGGIIVFGQDATIVRVLSSGKLRIYSWKKFIYKCSVISLTIGAIFIMFILFFYEMSKFFIYVTIAVICAVCIKLYTSVLRASGRYEIAVFFTRGFSILFFLLILFLWGMHILPKINIELLLVCYLMCFLTVFTFLFIIIINNFPEGKKRIDSQEIKNGIWLFLISISFTTMVNINHFFIAKMLDYNNVAIYSIGRTITRGFDLVSSAVWFVMMPTYSKKNKFSICKDSLKVFLVALIIAIFYMFFGEFLIKILFNNKYNSVIPILPFFIAIGVLQVVYSIPSSVIGGVFSSRFLRTFFGFSLISIFINGVGNLIFIPNYGVRGSLFSTMIAWIFRVISAYFVVYLSNNSIVESIKKK